MPRQLTDQERKLWQRVAQTVAQNSPQGASTQGASASSEPSSLDPQTGPLTSRHVPSPEQFEAILGEPTRRHRRKSDLASQAKRPSLVQDPSANPVNRRDIQDASRPVKAGRRVETERGKKVRRGKISIDVKIDLHGLTLSEAENAFKASILQARRHGQRTLLVVTGKGARLEGKIRTALPGWVNHPDISLFIASYAQAHIRHGGSGAWYVFVKRAEA